MRSWEHCGQWGLFTERVNSGCGDLGAGHFLRGCGVPARSSSAYLARVELHSVHCHEPLREAAPQAVGVLRRQVSLLPPSSPARRAESEGRPTCVRGHRAMTALGSRFLLIECRRAFGQWQVCVCDGLMVARSRGMRCYWPSNLIPQLCACDGPRGAVKGCSRSRWSRCYFPSNLIPQTPVRSLSPPSVTGEHISPRVDPSPPYPFPPSAGRPACGGGVEVAAVV